MIYLFERLYLDSDYYIRNDKTKMAALLGRSAVEAKQCKTLKYDFGKLQLDEKVENKDLAKYLTDLITTADGQRVTVYTDHATLIKILAFYCSSVFQNPTPAFVKKLIALDQLWIETNPGLSNPDFSYRYKQGDKFDIDHIDSLINEGMSITPKLTNLTDVRIEYALGAYINGSLSATQRELLEDKMLQMFCRAFWLGDHIKTYGPTYLTLAHNQGLDLDNFTLNELTRTMSNYSKIFNIGIDGSVEAFNKTTAQDHLEFMLQADRDFSCKAYPPEIRELYINFYKNKKEFVKKYVLTPENSAKYYAAFCSYTLSKANPYLWYNVAGEAANQEYIDNFKLNV